MSEHFAYMNNQLLRILNLLVTACFLVFYEGLRQENGEIGGQGGGELRQENGKRGEQGRGGLKQENA
jgi:hypothetical protein